MCVHVFAEERDCESQEMSSFSVGAAFKFVNAMYLLVIIIMCCLSSAEWGICLSRKLGVVKEMIVTQETTIPSLAAFFHGSLEFLKGKLHAIESGQKCVRGTTYVRKVLSLFQSSNPTAQHTNPINA